MAKFNYSTNIWIMIMLRYSSRPGEYNQYTEVSVFLEVTFLWVRENTQNKWRKGLCGITNWRRGKGMDEAKG